MREYVGPAACVSERRKRDRKRPRIILIELGCVQLLFRCDSIDNVGPSARSLARWDAAVFLFATALKKLAWLCQTQQRRRGHR